MTKQYKNLTLHEALDAKLAGKHKLMQSAYDKASGIWGITSAKEIQADYKYRIAIEPFKPEVGERYYVRDKWPEGEAEGWGEEKYEFRGDVDGFLVFKSKAGAYVFWDEVKPIESSKPENKQTSIKLNGAEIQSGSSRQRWAEGLIMQMPTSHNGRNSWLLNYGVSDEAVNLRKNHDAGAVKWDESTQSAETRGEFQSNPIEPPKPVARKGWIVRRTGEEPFYPTYDDVPKRFKLDEHDDYEIIHVRQVLSGEEQND